MVYDALHAHPNLDLVMLGDSIMERWNGTRGLGTETVPGAKEMFFKYFTRAHGGHLEGLALGSSGDTVRDGTI